jgi:hypothetical protein
MVGFDKGKSQGMNLSAFAYFASRPLIDKYGAKRIIVLNTFIAAICTRIFFLMPILWLAKTFDMIHVWFGAMGTIAEGLLS